MKFINYKLSVALETEVMCFYYNFPWSLSGLQPSYYLTPCSMEHIAWNRILEGEILQLVK